MVTPGQRLALNYDDRDKLRKFLRRAKDEGAVAVFALSINLDGKPEYFVRGDMQVVGLAMHKIAEGLVERGLQVDGLMRKPWYARALRWLREALRRGSK